MIDERLIDRSVFGGEIHRRHRRRRARSRKAPNWAVFVAAADLYRDSTIKRKAQYINSELLAQIEPQLELLGTVKTQNYHYDDYPGVICMEDPWKVRYETDMHSNDELQKKATHLGADYIVDKKVESWPEMHLEGMIYKIIRSGQLP